MKAMQLLRAEAAKAGKASLAASAVAVAATYAAGSPLVFVTPPLAALAVFWHLVRKDRSWRRWLQGAAGEWRTGRLLRPLIREGWWVGHDRAIKGSRANIDHLLIHPSGLLAVVIDTKAYHSGSVVRKSSGGHLWYGRHSLGSVLNTVNWELGKVSTALNVPVKAVIAVDRGRVQGRTVVAGGVTVTESALLLDLLRSMSSRAASPAAVRRVAKLVNSEFPKY